MLHNPNTQMTTPFQISFPVAVTADRLPQRLPPRIRRSRRLAFECTAVGKGMSSFHEIELEVREHELNQLGVVKHSVYANYCEYGVSQTRDKFGYNDETLDHALSEASYKYIAPLKKQEKFLLKVRIYDYSAARLYFENFIFKLPNLEPIMEGKATLVSLDKSWHAVRIPRSLISKIDQFNLTEESKRHIIK